VKGEVVYLYAFDVANEIVTARVGQILGQKPFTYEIQIQQALPKYGPLYRPLAIELPPPKVSGPGNASRLLVRVYEVGVVTVTVHVAIECAKVLDLLPLHHSTLADGRSLDVLAGELCAQVCDSLRPHLLRGSPQTEPEVYTAFCLTELPGVSDVAAWLAAERRNLAGLLTQTDPASLSEAQVAEALRLVRSFNVTDLAIIDWDAALVVDLTGYVEDVLYVLELANLQLEEFRVMDQKLDRYLNRAYDDLERSRLVLFGASARILRGLRSFRVDLTRLTDEVTHITKFLGDWYLARVYLAARERFYLDQWRHSVEERLGQLDQLYSVLHTESNERRMLWLEATIVFLFLIDLIIIFFVKK
jgi:hypothetical protein